MSSILVRQAAVSRILGRRPCLGTGRAPRRAWGAVRHAALGTFRPAQGARHAARVASRVAYGTRGAQPAACGARCAAPGARRAARGAPCAGRGARGTGRGARGVGRCDAHRVARGAPCGTRRSARSARRRTRGTRRRAAANGHTLLQTPAPRGATKRARRASKPRSGAWGASWGGSRWSMGVKSGWIRGGSGVDQGGGSGVDQGGSGWIRVDQGGSGVANHAWRAESACKT